MESQAVFQAKNEANFFPIELPPSSTTSLAFSIVLHRDVAILEHQLKLLFRPNHAFCLHVDAKAPEKILMAVQAIVDCYRNRLPFSNA